MPDLSVTLPPRWRMLRRRLARHRRLVAAALTAVAVVTGIAATRPAPAPTVGVLVAATDLAGGSLLTDADIKVARVPEELVPAGALRPEQRAGLEGRALAGPMRAGEIITDVRLVGPSLLAGYLSTGDAVTVAVPVRIVDAGAARLVRPGDRIDVLAAASPSEFPVVGARVVADVVASGVQVVTIPDEDDELALADGALIVVATSERVATDLAAAAVTSRLSLTLRPD